MLLIYKCCYNSLAKRLKKINLSSKAIEFLCVHIFGKGMNLEFGLECFINELSLGVLLYLNLQYRMTETGRGV